MIPVRCRLLPYEGEAAGSRTAFAAQAAAIKVSAPVQTNTHRIPTKAASEPPTSGPTDPASARALASTL